MASQPAPKDESIEGVHDLDEEVPESTSTTGVRARPEQPSRKEPRSPASHFGRVVGTSPAMRRLFPLCERLAKTDVPVIIEGETGTGKEVVAQSLHEASPRKRGPFVIFDCTTVPPSLVESALFGHERGSFTGAVNAHTGVFEQANGGTLFLDEIGDLEFGLQSKLLRAIERAEVQRVGGAGWTRVDVRVLCATRRDLQRAIKDGRFRDDLYYRLAVARITLPPLREREGDIIELLRYFWDASGGVAEELDRDFVSACENYSWPGNVRELHNAVAHRIALGELADFSTIRRVQTHEEDFRSLAVQEGTERDVVDDVIERAIPFLQAREVVVADFERRYCEAVLRRHGGNVTKASAASGIGRRYFYVIRGRSGTSFEE